jgi:MFS family permease
MRAVRVGCALQACQQLVGVNTVMYYATTILQTAGFAGGTLAAESAVQATNLAFTAFGLVAVERYGRREVLMASLVVLSVGLLTLAVAFLCDGGPRAPLCVIGLVVYVGGVAVGMGPVPWMVNAEIYEGRYRSAGVAMGAVTNWLASLLTTATFLGMCSISAAGTFLLYASCGLGGLALVWKQLPETKGGPRDDIPKLFREGEGYHQIELSSSSTPQQQRVAATPPVTPRGAAARVGSLQRFEVAHDAKYGGPDLILPHRC